MILPRLPENVKDSRARNNHFLFTTGPLGKLLWINHLFPSPQIPPSPPSPPRQKWCINCPVDLHDQIKKSSHTHPHTHTHTHNVFLSCHIHTCININNTLKAGPAPKKCKLHTYLMIADPKWLIKHPTCAPKKCSPSQLWIPSKSMGKNTITYDLLMYTFYQVI